MNAHICLAPRLNSRIWLVAVAALLIALPARAAPDPAMVQAAKKEGQLTWYTTLIINQIVRPLSDAFEAKYGIKVAASRASGNDTALKIINEARARRTQADIFDGTSTIFPLLDAGLVAAYPPKAVANWPDELRDPKGLWSAMNVYYFTAAYNTNLVPAADVPKTYEDLLDPKWKGKIAWTYDLSPGGPPGFIHNILTVMGEEKGMAYLRKFAAQEPVTIPAAQRVVLDKVIAGEYPLCVMILNHHVPISAAKGAPVEWIRMQPVVASTSLISIVKDAPHPNAAKLFEEFVLSDDGQKLLAANDYLPANPDVPAKVPELKPQAGHFTTTTFTLDDIRTGLPKWTAIYHELFR